MRARRQISYDDIAEIGKSLIMEQTDLVWEEDDKERAVSACIVSGIISFLDRLDKATRISQEDIDKVAQGFKNSYITSFCMDSEDLNKYNDENNCGRE